MSLTPYLSGVVFSGLSSTGSYYNQLVDSVAPTVTFLYENVLSNSIFYGIIIAILVIGFFSFGDN